MGFKLNYIVNNASDPVIVGVRAAWGVSRAARGVSRTAWGGVRAA